MIPLTVIRRWALLSCFIIMVSLGAVCQSIAMDSGPWESKNYVVMGAFSYQKNAQRFTSFLEQKEFHASYKLNPSRQLFYVYVYTSSQKDDALEEVARIRSLYPEFKDVWIYQGTFDRLGQQKAPSNEIDNVPERKPENPGNIRVSGQGPGSVKPSGYRDNEVGNTTSPSNISSQDITERVSGPVKPLVKKEGTHYFYFNVLNAKNYKEVKGRVKVIDPVRAKELLTAQSHEIVEIREPNNGTNTVKVSSDIFGFKEVQHIVDLGNPVNDSTSSYINVHGDSIVVDFELERYRKGDVIVMYNVYFFRDAAIMKPESVYELNSLLDMLNENEKFKVRIHGHTNGKSTGKILHLDEEDKNFFSLNGKHKEDFGSAKKLSLFRAYTIQHWLIDQGIARERMEIKGWGGKQMLYDKHHNQADRNVRVEIEITAD
ncbi:OmpA family protein [Fulvivirga sp. M361]|uniref:OmpA family protein n=1 Tax=Fulvivirga sp. M361 TaxID=2594266 RepID=UPI00117ADBA9|nr:OmpA family protein [Fulvivirga sp. M361]TRX56192.1 OmpA family protein [Fulvivirga sp. M361]